MNAAGAVDVVLERLRRVAGMHWSDVTLEPLLDLWCLAPALLARLSPPTPHVPDEARMPTENVDVEQWLADAERHTKFMQESAEHWQHIAGRWALLVETSSVDQESRRRTHRGAVIIAEGRQREAAQSAEIVKGLRALLAEQTSAPPG